MALLRCCLLEALRLQPVIGAAIRVTTRDVDVGEYHLPKGSTIFLPLVPHGHINPLRKPLPAEQRRCPFDADGIDRTATGHDGFDFNPHRWLEEDGLVSEVFDAGAPDALPSSASHGGPVEEERQGGSGNVVPSSGVGQPSATRLPV